MKFRSTLFFLTTTLACCQAQLRLSPFGLGGAQNGDDTQQTNTHHEQNGVRRVVQTRTEVYEDIDNGEDTDNTVRGRRQNRRRNSSPNFNQIGGGFNSGLSGGLDSNINRGFNQGLQNGFGQNLNGGLNGGLGNSFSQGFNNMQSSGLNGNFGGNGVHQLSGGLGRRQNNGLARNKINMGSQQVPGDLFGGDISGSQLKDLSLGGFNGFNTINSQPMNSNNGVAKPKNNPRGNNLSRSVPHQAGNGRRGQLNIPGTEATGLRLYQFVDTQELNEKAGTDVQGLLDDNRRETQNKQQSQDVDNVHNIIQEQTGGMNTGGLVRNSLQQGNQAANLNNLGGQSRQLARGALNDNNLGNLANSGGNKNSIGGSLVDNALNQGRRAANADYGEDNARQLTHQVLDENRMGTENADRRRSGGNGGIQAPSLVNGLGGNTSIVQGGMSQGLQQSGLDGVGLQGLIQQAANPMGKKK